MNLSCCVWALSVPEKEALALLAETDFKWIDIQPQMLHDAGARAFARELGLQISCVGASFGMPDGAALDSSDPEVTALALDHVERAVWHAARLGASAAYVVPGLEVSPEALNGYADSLIEVADMADASGLKLCVEHFPGRALPTAAATLEFLREINHPNLYLLFDIGHIQMAGEDPVAVIKAAGPLLGYVHLDDNDGQGDLHWSLLDGVLTKETLRRTFGALADIGYSGPVSLELSPNLPDPLAALEQSREIVLEIGGEWLA